MQATPQDIWSNGRLSRNLGIIFIVPLVTLAVLTLLLAVMVVSYQSQHADRIYTGVVAAGVDLSQMTPAEAEAALAEAMPFTEQQAITLRDPLLAQTWDYTPAELGLSLDGAATVASAMEIGREGNPLEQFQSMFRSWYYGRSVSPVFVLDEAQLQQKLDQISAVVNQPTTNATINMAGDTVRYLPGQPGRTMDVADAQARLLEPLTALRPIEMELRIDTVQPAVFDDAPAATEILQTLSGPMTFYLQEPLQDVDLGRVTRSAGEIQQWVRVELVQMADGAFQHEMLVDDNAVRHWLSQYEDELYREPVRARFYFDDNTEELVLVDPHVNGRSLDIDATLALFKARVATANRTVPFVLAEIVPTVNSNATAAELGITELLSERTTWFYGSSDERKHNIARSAANFYGIVIEPGEEFSFNQYIGSISEADGYEEGFIIVDGIAIPGIGGGICQVSTTIFQTAFFGGFPITERWQHGYMLNYYNDGEGAGMDATVYSPIVDFKFINNTPHHLLIENYYNEENQALTVKMYSTSLGRTVEKIGPIFENRTPERPRSEDVWTFDPDMDEGEVLQVDWATFGARVTVGQVVRNADGDVIYQRDYVSDYLPIADGFRYGPGVEERDYTAVPPDPYANR